MVKLSAKVVFYPAPTPALVPGYEKPSHMTERSLFFFKSAPWAPDAYTVFFSKSPLFQIIRVTLLPLKKK